MKAAGFGGAWVLIASVLALSPKAAQAETTSPSGTGIAGGALLGLEFSSLTQTAFGVKAAWSYVLGGAASAAVGGAAGYFATRDTRPEVADYIFGASVALLIPSVIWISRAHEPNPRDRQPRPSLTPPPAPNGNRPTLARNDAAPERLAWSRTATLRSNLILDTRYRQLAAPHELTWSVVLARGNF